MATNIVFSSGHGEAEMMMMRTNIAVLASIKNVFSFHVHSFYCWQKVRKLLDRQL